MAEGRSAQATGAKAVLFDFDGVLTTDRVGSDSTIRALGRVLGMPEEQVADAYHAHVGDLVLGLKTHDDVLPALSSTLGMEVTGHQVREAFAGTPINQPMLDLARSLASRYRTGIVTDNPSDRMRCIVGLHGLDALFDPIVVSADAGTSKSSEGIFVMALEVMGLSPSEVVFIDNSERNIVMARQVGIHAIHHDDAVNDIERLIRTLGQQFGIETA